MKLISTPEGPFYVWANDHLGQVLETGAFWDGQLLPYMQEALAAHPDTWAIDLGASIGVFTVWLAKRFAHVLSVEMHPGTYELLRMNIKGHGVEDKVSSWQVAAYDREAFLALAGPEYLGWPLPADLNSTPNASSIALIEDPAGSFVGVRADSLVPQDAEVGLVKVDVQGCDLRALHGLEQTITRCRPLILFEFEGGPSSWHKCPHCGHADAWEDYARFFDRLGYDIQPVGSPMDFVARPK